jgi:hypothetical protein
MCTLVMIRVTKSLNFARRVFGFFHSRNDDFIFVLKIFSEMSIKSMKILLKNITSSQGILLSSDLLHRVYVAG